MVYCNLAEVNDEFVTYAIGGRTDDITGKLTVNLKSGNWEIEQPENSQVAERHVASMLGKAFPDFKKGVFKERLSYQIG